MRVYPGWGQGTIGLPIQKDLHRAKYLCTRTKGFGWDFLAKVGTVGGCPGSPGARLPSGGSLLGGTYGSDVESNLLTKRRSENFEHIVGSLCWSRPI